MTMATKEYKIVCSNPQCKTALKVSIDEKAKAFAVTCPKCGRRINVKLKQAVELEMANDTTKKVMWVNCPQDKHRFSVVCPPKAGIYAITCPKCGKKYKVNMTQEAIDKSQSVADRPSTVMASASNKMQESESIPPTVLPNKEKTDTDLIGETSPVSIGGKLVLLRRFFHKNKEFPLEIGTTIIGRKDSELPSDIQIDNDKSMSRRSVKIEVSLTKQGYLFKLEVLKATNQVLLNNKVVSKGEIYPLTFGDSIIMGKTKFRFEKIY